MIWKDYFKLSEIASYSKLARASKAPPPPLSRRNRVNADFVIASDDILNILLHPLWHRFTVT